MEQRPVVLAGHGFYYESALGVELRERRSTHGGLLARCLCGWQSIAVPSKTIAKRTYLREHMDGLRALAKRTCRVCCEIKLPADMARGKDAGNICKKCLTAKTQAWATLNPARWNSSRWASHLRKSFGITVEQYDAMLARQRGACAICRIRSTDSPRRLHVDHDHKSGRVRGLLCYRCNTGIGVFLEDSARLRAAIRYLRNVERTVIDQIARAA
jgi:hypothetical protein